MNFNEHLTAARTVLNDFGTYIEANASLHAFPASTLPHEKVVLKNAIIISALEDRSDTNMEFCRLAFHILATTLEDSEANFVNHYFATITRGDEDAINSLDVDYWNKLRGKINQEFAAYEGEMRALMNQVALISAELVKEPAVSVANFAQD